MVESVGDPRYLKEGLVCLLYANGKLSEREACDVSDISCRTFEELLPRFGYAVLADDDETVENELNAWKS